MSDRSKRWSRFTMPVGVVVSGVWLMVIGLVSFVLTVLDIKAAQAEIPFPVVVVTIALPLLTAAAAGWMLSGENAGRISVLVILPLNLLWWLTFVIGALTDESSENDMPGVMLLIRSTFTLLWVVAIEWYLLSGQVANYFNE